MVRQLCYLIYTHRKCGSTFFHPACWVGGFRFWVFFSFAYKALLYVHKHKRKFCLKTERLDGLIWNIKILVAMKLIQLFYLNMSVNQSISNNIFQYICTSYNYKICVSHIFYDKSNKKYFFTDFTSLTSLCFRSFYTVFHYMWAF